MNHDWLGRPAPKRFDWGVLVGLVLTVALIAAGIAWHR